MRGAGDLSRVWAPLALAAALLGAAPRPTASAQPPPPPDEPMDAGAPLDASLPEGGLPEGGVVAAERPEPEIVVPEVDRRNLRVGVVGNPPFHVHAEGEPPRGISVDLWRAVAARMEVDYELVPFRNASAGVDALADGSCDVLIGPVSITSERAARVSFTQPYWEASLAILAQADGGGLWERVRPFLTRAFFGGVTVLLVILTLVGALLWIFERKPNDQFPKTPLAGIGVGIWLALVTMTTVGYGDKAPITLPGRILTGVWMVIAMLTASSLTAGIATALTLAQLDRGAIANAGELSERRVAVIDGTTAELFARRHRARIVEVEDVAEAVTRLDAGEVDAVVFDRPVLQYHLGQNDQLELALSAEEYEPVGYGFAAPLYSPLLRELDVHLLALRENGELDAIAAEYF